MSFSKCPRCEAPDYRVQKGCAECEFSSEAGADDGVPIPNWVLQYIETTPAVLEEIKEINFGIPPVHIAIPKKAVGSAEGNARQEAKEAPVQVTKMNRTLFRKAPKLMRDCDVPFEFLETNQCAM